MKNSKLPKFAITEVPSKEQLSLKGGIDCDGVAEVIHYLEFYQQYEQLEVVLNQYLSGGIQGCQP